MDKFTRLGEYYANSIGPTVHEEQIRLPNGNGVYQRGLVWGYDYWPSPECPAEPCPNAGAWRVTQDLRVAHGLPSTATGVRVHIKAKTFAGANPVSAVQAACQISARPYGITASPNELCHTVIGKASNALNQNEYDLNHMEFDMVLPESGKLSIWLYPSIADGYAQIALNFYLAGYWSIDL